MRFIDSIFSLMKKIISIIVLFITSISLFAHWQPNSFKNNSYTIEWNKETLVCISEEGCYPRMERLSDKSLIVVYENLKGDVLAKKSFDEGQTWSKATTVYSHFEYKEANQITNVRIANPELISLPNGDILFACNLRPDKEGIFPLSISIKRSTDKGNSWHNAKVVYEADSRFKDGCWEPSFLLLPDGTLHLYFANENPYKDSDDQEISMISSKDYGKRWTSKITKVCYRVKHRDGMPVAIIDNDEIFVLIEDNEVAQFKPYIVKSSIYNAWEKPVLSNSKNRYAALDKPLHESVYAGAPYFIRMDNELFVISYQTTENRTSNWELSAMEVAISDSPQNFKNPSRPFDVPLSKEAKWNSLTDLGNNVIAALSSTNFNSQTIGVWMIKGEIIKKLR